MMTVCGASIAFGDATTISIVCDNHVARHLQVAKTIIDGHFVNTFKRITMFKSQTVRSSAASSQPIHLLETSTIARFISKRMHTPTTKRSTRPQSVSRIDYGPFTLYCMVEFRVWFPMPCARIVL